MTRWLLLSLVGLLSGCEFIAPDVSKAQSELKQIEYDRRQAEALERIADYLEAR